MWFWRDVHFCDFEEKYIFLWFWRQMQFLVILRKIHFCDFEQKRINFVYCKMKANSFWLIVNKIHFFVILQNDSKESRQFQERKKYFLMIFQQQKTSKEWRQFWGKKNKMTIFVILQNILGSFLVTCKQCNADCKMQLANSQENYCKLLDKTTEMFWIKLNAEEMFLDKT